MSDQWAHEIACLVGLVVFSGLAASLRAAIVPADSATPDSANVPLTKMARPDAFDFNSTKYDCDWASLTDAAGKGLRVEVAADQRRHVRAGFEPNGTFQLIVNRQCSPPRDISSPVVNDFYLKLSAGEIVEGAFRVGGNGS